MNGKAEFLCQSVDEDTKVCIRCGKEFRRNPRYSDSQWNRAIGCSRSCAATKRSASDTEIINMYGSGKSSAEIGEEVGISAAQVLKVLRSNGVKTRSGGEAQRLSHARPDVRERLSRSSRRLPCQEHVKQTLREYIGPKNSNWRSGVTVTPAGYIGFTASLANGVHAGRLLHQIIGEWKVGRKLLPGEVVHHADGDKLNNNPENLVVMTQSEHMKVHVEMRRM